MLLLDASALIALVKKERGFRIVEAALPHAAVGSVNWVETIAWVRRHEPDSEPGLTGANFSLIGFGASEAHVATRLLAAHDGILSLGDCACLATAELHRLPVLTADRIWADLNLPVEIRLIR